MRRTLDFIVEHARGIGDKDSEPRRRLGVDIVVADAETRDDLELGVLAHIGFIERRVAAGRRAACCRTAP